MNRYRHKDKDKDNVVVSVKHNELLDRLPSMVLPPPPAPLIFDRLTF